MKKSKVSIESTMILNTVEHSAKDSQKLENEQMFSFVFDKLDLLRDKDKELIIFRYIEELEIKEIAKILNKSYNATKIAIHRALNKLKDLIDVTEP